MESVVWPAAAIIIALIALCAWVIWLAFKYMEW